MTTPRGTDAQIKAFFETPQPELPDRTFDAVRVEIQRTRQVGTLGRLEGETAPRFGMWLIAAALVISVGVLALAPRSGFGPASPPSPSVTTPATTDAMSATPSPQASGSTASPTPAGPTSFTSPLYGYSVTLPAGWSAAQAFLHWDGIRAPGPDADVDKFVGPEQQSAFAYAGPFDGTLREFADDRIAATARDHADTCPRPRPELDEPLSIGTQRWIFLGWNCGAVINLAVTLRGGAAYAFTFRDLAIAAPSDPADRALFESILESVQFPS